MTTFKAIKESLIEAVETAFYVIFFFYLILIIINEVTNNVISDYINIDFIFAIVVLLALCMFVFKDKGVHAESLPNPFKSNSLLKRVLKVSFNALISFFIGVLCFWKFEQSVWATFLLSILIGVLSFIFLQFS